MVDIPIDASGPVLLGLPYPWGVVDADIEDCATMERRERKLIGGGLGDSLHRALGLGVWILLWDGLEGHSRASADVEHVDSRRRLVGDLVSERMDVSHLVSEFAP